MPQSLDDRSVDALPELALNCEALISKAKASEGEPIRTPRLLCGGVLSIPLYQRAYAWATEESEELLQDLMRAMGGYEGSIDDLSPYFLGSIVLIKGDESLAEVIDGQQRLTTLTMLLAALRSFIKSEYVEGLTSFLCEKGNAITGTPKRYRLRLRERDAQFFQKYIQDEGGYESRKFRF